MKRLTILFDDRFELKDFDEVLANAIEFHMERLPDTPSAPKKKMRTIHKGSDGMTTQKAVMSHHTPSGMFKKELAEKWLSEHGFALTSASPAISALKKSGHLEEIGPMKYRFLKPLD